MVLFTLTGLNVDVGLYEFVEYPTYDFPDVSASYYLDLSFNPIYFDNIFYFKTTNPDLNSNVRIEYIAPTTDLGGLKPSTNIGTLNNREYKDFFLTTSTRLLTLSELQNYLTVNGPITHYSDGTPVTFSSGKGLSVTTYNPDSDTYENVVVNTTNSTKTLGQIRPHNDWGSSAYDTPERAAVGSSYFSSDGLTNTNSSAWNYAHTSEGRNKIQVYYSENIFLGVSGEQNLPDMAFKCESSNWPDILYSEGVISNDSRSDINNYLPPPSASGVHYNKNIGVQWLAKNITGGYNNSDLFANEEALVQQYVTLNKYDFTSLIGEQNNVSFAVNSDPTNYRYIRFIINSIHPYNNRTRASIAYINLYSNIIYSEPTVNQQTSNRYNYISSFTTNDITTSPDFTGNAPRLTSHGGGHPVQYFGSGYYDPITGLVKDTAPISGNIYGSWVQFDLEGVGLTTNDIKHFGMSFDKGTYSKGLNTYANDGTTANKIIAVGSNDNSNFNVLGTFYSSIKLTETSQWLYNHLGNSAESAHNGHSFSMFRGTFESYSTIKHLITNTLDVSGGSDADPLSNLDTGRNNVAREALLHLLDNSISSNVQRVHNMITKARTNVDSNGNDISFGDTSNLWIPIEFFDSDTIKFKLIYKPDQITDGSGVAIDDSGNALGTNTIEDQDYVVRLNMVGQRSDLFLRSSFLSSSVVENNVTINGNNHTLLDNIIQPNSSVNRNSNTVSVNDVTVYNDTTFGSYVKVGRAHIGPTNSGDTLYNYYTWNKNNFNQKTTNYNWTYGSLYNNSVYLTWIFRLHSGGYNKSIASQDIVPISYSTSDNVDLTNDSINIFSEGNMTNVLNNPQQFAVFYSKHFGDANRNCTFGFFNGKYHFCNGDMGAAVSIPLSSSMTNASEQQWRVLTLAIGPHSNNSGSNSEVSIFENGILLGNTNRNFSTLSGYGDNSTAFGISGQGDNFVMGSFQGQGGIITNHLPSMRTNESGTGLQGTNDDRHFKNTLPYDLALWELHESSATGVNISFKANQIYADYVNKYKYDFINGVSTA